MATLQQSLPCLHRQRRLALVTALVRYSKTGTTAFTTGSQNPTAIACSHALTESVTVFTFSIRGLVSAFSHD